MMQGGQLNNKSRSFWRRLGRDYGPRFYHRGGEKRGRRNHTNQSKHLTIDQLAAKRKFEQLKLLTTTDLAIINSAEPYRVSNFDLFKRNLLDPTIYLTITIAYLICKLVIIGTSSSILSSIISFGVIFLIIDYHIESYRSFTSIKQTVDVLSKDNKLRKEFLSTHLGYNPSRQVRVPIVNPNSLTDNAIEEIQVEVAESIEIDRKDTFHWINRIILFFWPYLSHLIHFELNEFFRNQIESGSMGRSEERTKRLLYALLRQLNTNILVIERCQLGDQAPFLRNISVSEGCVKKEASKAEAEVEGKQQQQQQQIKFNIDKIKETNETGKTLVYNINLDYSGDMNISVIYRYLCCCTSRVGLRDVFLHFNMQLIVGPIKSDIPFIDQLSFTLLELPEFGYRGIALVELAELKFVRRVINRLITEHLLYPQKISISLKQLIETLLNGPKEVEVKAENIVSKQLPPVQQQQQQQNDDLSCRTRIAANLLLFGCMCSNAFLRCCQKTTSPLTTTISVNGKNSDTTSSNHNKECSISPHNKEQKQSIN